MQKLVILWFAAVVFATKVSILARQLSVENLSVHYAKLQESRTVAELDKSANLIVTIRSSESTYSVLFLN